MAGNTVSTNVVIRINDREVTNSFTGINREVRRLERELRGAEVGSENFTRTFDELQEARGHLERVRQEIQGTTEDLRESSQELRNFSDIGPYLADRLTSNISLSNLSFQSLGTGIRTFAAQSWAAIGSIPIIGWIAAIAAGIGLAVKEVFDFNKELYEQNKLTQQYTKLRGEALDTMTVRTNTIEEMFGFDKEDTLKGARSAVNAFKITYTEAMDEIEIGLAKGGAANKEYFESINEYAPFLAKAGYSFKDFISIINAGFDLGIYQDKLPDAIKEFDLSIREQGKSTRDALVNAFGATFSDDLLGRVSKGKTTVKDALIEISKESDKYNLTQKQQAQLTADIFRGAGEDVGGFAKIMEAVNLSIIEQGKNLTAEQQIIKDQLDNYNELGEAKIDALKSDSIMAFKRDAENAWIAIQKGWYNMIATLRTGHTFVKAIVMTIAEYVAVVQVRVTNLFSAAMTDVSNIASAFKDLATAFKALAKLDLDGADNAFDRLKDKMKTAFSGTKKAMGELGKESGISFLGNLNKILAEDKLKADAQRIIDQKRENTNKPTNSFDGSQEAAKAAEAARKKALAEAKKAAAANKKLQDEIKKDLEESVKDYDNAEKRKLDTAEKIQAEKFKLIRDSLSKELEMEESNRQQELRKLIENGQVIQDKIIELEQKKLSAKSSDAKQIYDKTLKEEIQARYQNDLLIQATEETHQLKLKTIREKWDAKKIEDYLKSEQEKSENAALQHEDEIQKISSLEDAKIQLQKNVFLKLSNQELSQVDSLEKAKALLREEANRALLAESEKAMSEQLTVLEKAVLSLTDGPEKDKLLEYIKTLKKRIQELRGTIQGNEESDENKKKDKINEAKSDIDILGFSYKQWEDTFNNLDTLSDKVKAAAMVFQALGNAATLYGDLQRAVGERELKNFTKIQDAKKVELDKKLKLGLISQENYNKETELLDAQLANKQAEIEYKQAKAEKISKLFSAIGGVAMGVANSLAVGGPVGIALAAIVGALGAVQIATIAAQPLPELQSYAQGGFFEGYTGESNLPVDETGERPVGLVKLHRREWTAPRWMTEHPVISKDIQRLEFMRANKITSFAEGGFADKGNTASSVALNPTSNDSTMVQYIAVMNDVKSLLRLIYDEGVQSFIVDDAKNWKRINRMNKKWETLENKNKH